MNLLATLKQHGIEFQKGSQQWIRLECPECRSKGKKYEDKTLSFHVVGLPHTGNCFRCGWSGNEKNLLQALSISILQENEFSSLERQKPKSFIQDIPAEAIEAWPNKEARTYLQSRGISEEQATLYAIYYAPSGFYAGRLIIPIFDHRGQYRSFVSRSIHDQVEGPKYRYPRGSCVASLLYNLLFIVGKQQHCIITEGVFDAIHCAELGAIASFGKNITKAQINLLRLTGMREVFLLWDAECWQQTPEIWQKAVNKLSKYFIVWEVRLKEFTPTEYSIEELQEICYENSTFSY